MLKRGVIAAVFMSLVPTAAYAQKPSVDQKKLAKRAAQCSAIFDKLRFSVSSLSANENQKKAIDANWQFWSERALKITPEKKYKKYQKSARKSIYKSGASNAFFAACDKERKAILVSELDAAFMGDLSFNDDVRKAMREQKLENSKPENVVLCKYVADKLLSYHAKDAADFDREPSKQIVADARAANLAYEALGAERTAHLEADAKARTEKIFNNGDFKPAADMCMPGFFRKSASVVSPLELVRKRAVGGKAAK